jgi:hypothetical protein
MSFEDAVESGVTYWYRVRLETTDGETVLSRALPATSGGWTTNLRAPRLVNGGVELRYSIARRTDVRLDIWDVRGRLVHTVERGVREPGEYRATWKQNESTGGRAARGIYFVRLDAGGETLARKLVHLQP